MNAFSEPRPSFSAHDRLKIEQDATENSVVESQEIDPEFISKIAHSIRYYSEFQELETQFLSDQCPWRAYPADVRIAAVCAAIERMPQLLDSDKVRHIEKILFLFGFGGHELLQRSPKMNARVHEEITARWISGAKLRDGSLQSVHFYVSDSTKEDAFFRAARYGLTQEMLQDPEKVTWLKKYLIGILAPNGSEASSAQPRGDFNHLRRIASKIERYGDISSVVSDAKVHQVVLSAFFRMLLLEYLISKQELEVLQISTEESVALIKEWMMQEVMPVNPFQKQNNIKPVVERFQEIIQQYGFQPAEVKDMQRSVFEGTILHGLNDLAIQISDAFSFSESEIRDVIISCAVKILSEGNMNELNTRLGTWNLPMQELLSDGRMKGAAQAGYTRAKTEGREAEAKEIETIFSLQKRSTSPYR